MFRYECPQIRIFALLASSLVPLEAPLSLAGFPLLQRLLLLLKLQELELLDNEDAAPVPYVLEHV